MAFQLTSEAALRDWVVTSDSDNADGNSRAELVLGRNGKAVLRGTLDTTVPKDGSKQRAGYCNMRCLRPQVSPQQSSWRAAAGHTGSGWAAAGHTGSGRAAAAGHTSRRAAAGCMVAYQSLVGQLTTGLSAAKSHGYGYVGYFMSHGYRSACGNFTLPWISLWPEHDIHGTDASLLLLNELSYLFVLT